MNDDYVYYTGQTILIIVFILSVGFASHAAYMDPRS